MNWYEPVNSSYIPHWLLWILGCEFRRTYGIPSPHPSAWAKLAYNRFQGNFSVFAWSILVLDPAWNIHMRSNKRVCRTVKMLLFLSHAVTQVNNSLPSLFHMVNYNEDMQWNSNCPNRTLRKYRHLNVLLFVLLCSCIGCCLQCMTKSICHFLFFLLYISYKTH